MREVTQWILASDPSGVPGDCIRASVASLLDLDPMKVPHFICQDDVRVWHYALIAFAAEHGYRIDRRAVGEDEPLPEFGLAIGQSSRGVSHAVVAVGGKVVWDPHPSRDGLVDVRQVVEFIPNAPQGDPEALLVGVEVVLLEHLAELSGVDVDPNLAELACRYLAVVGDAAPAAIRAALEAAEAAAATCPRCGGEPCSECGECSRQGCWDCRCAQRNQGDDGRDSD